MSEKKKKKPAKKEVEEKLPSGVTLREHKYDGIQEYDQRLPNWWLFTFYIAIAYFIFYWLAFFQFNAIGSDSERLEAKLAKIEEARSEAMVAMLNDEGLWEMSRDDTVVAEGKAVYMRNCMACHAENLGGKANGPQYIGANLTDGTWVHGGNPTQVYKVIHDGVIVKGMQPWGMQLGPEGVAKVACFVLSYHEVSPPGEGPPPTPEAPAPGAPPETPAPGSPAPAAAATDA